MNEIQEESSALNKFSHTFTRNLQYLLDKTAPYSTFRWLAFIGFLSLYGFRVYLLDGWFIVTYGLGIFLLNNFIGFLTPQVDPEEQEDDSNMELPTTRQDGDEYRPFIRKVSEFKFWWTSMKSVGLAFAMTFFEFFNVPVFWPILLIYWFLLFFITMKKQIAHMWKHKYLPFDFGKKKYKRRRNPKEKAYK